MLLIHRWRIALYEVGEHGSAGMTPINWTASEYLYDRLTQLDQWLSTIAYCILRNHQSGTEKQPDFAECDIFLMGAQLKKDTVAVASVWWTV